MTDPVTPQHARLSANVGERLPDVKFGPITRAKLALYAGASGDHNPAHIDTDFANSAGMEDVIAHGMLSFGILAQVVTGWAGIGALRSMNTRFMSMTQVHDVITCSGAVTERIEKGGEVLARIALMTTAQDGRKTLVGEALVAVGSARDA